MYNFILNRYRCSLFFSLILLFPFVGYAAVEKKDTEEKTFIGWGFELKYPEDLDVEQHRGPDFFVYYFGHREANKVNLLIYAGDHPDLRNEHWKSCKTKVSKRKGMELKSIQWKSEHGSNKEMLISFGKWDDVKERGGPFHLHIIYSALDAKERKQAERIIESIAINGSKNFSPASKVEESAIPKTSDESASEENSGTKSPNRDSSIQEP